MNTRRLWMVSLLMSATLGVAQAAPSPQRAELAKRMTAIRDYIRKQPGLIDNAVMQNRNPGNKPDFAGVSRWKSFKDWENLWLKDDMQKLVRAVVEVGDIKPNTFSPLKP